MSALRRYNDRDVRDNPSLRQIAEDYLEQYTGEFEFLVDLKMRAALDYDLTDPMVRGVLNCMRNDPRVVDLPEPGVHEDGAEVVSMRRRKAKRKKEPAAEYEPDVCQYEGQEHDSHWYPSNRGGQAHCRGWHALNRGRVSTRARFHADYLRGEKSNVIHRSSHEGTVGWRPEDVHAEGASEALYRWVKPSCYVRELMNPDLLDAQGVKDAEPHHKPPGNRYEQMSLCQRCFPGTTRGDGPWTAL